MRYFLLLLSAALLFLSNGCYYDNQEELYPNSFCDTVNISYSGAIEPIIIAKCATPGCHVAGGSGSGDFTTYAGVIAKIQNNGPFLASILMSPDAIPMPPSGSPQLRSCEVRKIELWIAAGAPND